MIHHKETPVKSAVGPSSEAMEARRQWDVIVKCSKWLASAENPRSSEAG